MDTKWVKPEYSKSKVERSGKIYINEDNAPQIREDALLVIDNWRASHAYPLANFYRSMRKHAKDYEYAIFSQRLKRLDSITQKLERNPEMNLSRMQDLGGCRVILPRLDEVYSYSELFKSKNRLSVHSNEKDYIQAPKNSGYRSIHAVYKYRMRDKKSPYTNMQIEIQFRTLLQHSWATALEAMGIYRNEPLKAGLGDENILRFFILVSALFALEEKTEFVPDTPTTREKIVQELKDLDNEFDILLRLNCITVVIVERDKDESLKENPYYLLILDKSRGQLQIQTFHSKMVEEATITYHKAEKIDSKQDVVLVSAQSLDELKQAYPNYFLDIKRFLDKVKSYLN